MVAIDKRLMDAAKEGFEIELRTLLMYPGCDVLAKDTNSMTALMYAAYYGQEACLRLLIPVSDVLAKSENGVTSLMWAAGNGQEDCIKLLLAASDVLAKDLDKWTASSWAKNGGYKSVAQLIDAYALSQTEQASIEVAVNTSTPRKRAAPRV